MFQNEYFIIDRENNGNYPLFGWDQRRGEYGLGHPVEFEGVLKGVLKNPVSPNFQLVDFHKLPEPVVSELVAKLLIEKSVYGIQVVPMDVRNPGDPLSEVWRYYFLHVWNQIGCIDFHQSEVDQDDDAHIWEIEKLVLDESILKTIDENERLVFTLKEKTSLILVHESIKAMIESLGSKGCRFFKVSEWNSDSGFS